MKLCYVVTGGSGHLGSTILRALSGRGAVLRALVYPKLPRSPVPGVSYYVGDVRDPATMLPLFADGDRLEFRVIHTAGLVDLSSYKVGLLWQVNVDGTRNLLSLCREHGVRRFLYVSSVHALPPVPRGQKVREVSGFSPDLVVGDYAKSKAEATRLVLDAGKQGLSVTVVHPSGLLGPGDSGNNHLVQLLDTYLRGKLRFCVRGGYDFTDVRDVALGCIRALEIGKSGSCYLLTGQYCEIRDLLNMVRSVRNRPRPMVLPLWTAAAAAPAASAMAARKGQRPLFTPYAVYTLGTREKFSHEKASAELGYRPRPLRYTVRDTVLELLEKPE